jgi:peptidoglycan pentaglycine glycine transferase (the first glycine)
LVSKVVAKRGKFLLIQHGPSFTKASDGKTGLILQVLINEFKKIGKQEGVSFIRIAPLIENSKENLKIIRGLGFRQAPMHANAYEATWKLDITLGEEELMKNMRKTTRYLIRQAQKNPDIIIEKSPSFANASEGKAGIEDIKIYQNLNREVARRQKFVPFSDSYIENEFNLFSEDDQALWLFGKYKDKVAAAALVIFWQGTGYYHQAASLSKYAKFSIPYLLQWEAIKEAKKRGCKVYDFWGFTDPQKYSRHPWAGPTLFKMGFGGYNKEYVKTQDFVLSKRYWVTYLFENLRKIKRGY